MEMKRKRHPLRDLSLKWSFVLYVVICILIAVAFSASLSGLFSKLQNNIYQYYDELYQDELAKQGDLVVDGEIIQKGALRFYTEDLHDKFSAQDKRLYDLYGAMSILIVPIVSMISVLLAGVVFYMRKFKKPLTLLDSASTRIAGGDLDFTVEPGSRNELGRLAASFEIMRASLLEANRDLWLVMEGRARLNAAFAHDLRTPLTVLRGYCDFLRKYDVDSEKAQQTLSTMDVYLKRLEGYTETMASLQKLDELVLSLEEINFDLLCETLQKSGTMLASEKSLRFHGGGNKMLHIDLAAVNQVYENLLSNAMRYAKDEIKVSFIVDGDLLRIAVVDDGPGFAPEALRLAAEPYFRGEKDIADAAHFGIGLYISKLLCEKHGGSLAIENELGGKVTASFSICR